MGKPVKVIDANVYGKNMELITEDTMKAIHGAVSYNFRKFGFTWNEDLFNDYLSASYAHVCRYIHSYNDEKMSFKSWLIMCVNTAFKSEWQQHISKGQFHTKQFTNDTLPDSDEGEVKTVFDTMAVDCPYLETEAWDRINDVINRSNIKNKQMLRDIVALKYQGYSQREVAVHLGVSHSYVNKILKEIREGYEEKR